MAGWSHDGLFTMMRPSGKLAIIGWPVSHSRSPLIHNYWLAAHGLPALYEAYPISPTDDFGAALRAMADAGFVGANVTVPHKEAAFAAMDALSPAAQTLGAVNTISFKDGRLLGDNTDGDGFLAGLEAAAPDHGGKDGWQNAPALVLGAGGAARAIVAALGRAGIPDIRLVNRTRDRAEALSGLAANIAVGDWDARAKLADGCGLLVNTTSLGMAGQPPLDMPLDRLKKAALVSDIVYTPRHTELLRKAQKVGFIAVDGLGMLLNQAALSFEIWTDTRPRIDDGLRALLLADLTKKD